MFIYFILHILWLFWLALQESTPNNQNMKALWAHAATCNTYNIERNTDSGTLFNFILLLSITPQRSTIDEPIEAKLLRYPCV
jgi:hypothetical protein